MKTSRFIFTILATLTLGLATASDLNYTIRNLNKNMHISGPSLTEEDFKHKVVLIEEWGLHCPPCRASLPKMGELARKYAKDKRALIVGAHSQGRDDAAIRKLLADNKCDYPVYQFLTTSLAPAAPGIPNVYIIDHTGKLVWQGHPKNMAPVFEKYVKLVPNYDPNSLLGGAIELKAFKSYASNLRIGRNAERAIKQIEARKERNPEVAEEADAIITACYGWADKVVEEISTNLDAYPSKAVIAYQKLAKTFPSRAAEFKEAMAELSKDKVTSALVKARLNLDKQKGRTADTPNARKRIASSLRMPMDAVNELVKRLGDEVTEDVLDVQAEWQRLVDQFKE